MSTELTPEQERQVQERLREKECLTVAWMLKFMKEHFGDESYRIFVEAQSEGRRSHFGKLARIKEDNSIEMLIKVLFESDDEQAYEYTAEKRPSGIQVNVTRCWPYSMAERHGIAEQLFHTCCECERFMAEGFNPDIGFTRTKTLMQGDGCCDHFFYYKNKS